MREGLILEIAVLLVLGYSALMGLKRGFLLTILLVVKRILMMAIGFVIWRVLMGLVPNDAPYLVSGIVYMVAIAITGILFRFIWSIFRIVDHIPILKQINKLFGLVAGLIMGLLNVWIGFVIIRVFQATSIGDMLMGYIISSKALHFLYQINPLLPPVHSIMKWIESM